MKSVEGVNTYGSGIFVLTEHIPQFKKLLQEFEFVTVVKRQLCEKGINAGLLESRIARGEIKVPFAQGRRARNQTLLVHKSIYEVLGNK